MRTLAGAFGFSGDDVEKSCRVLSGGEKARLVLAKMLYDPPNFLVLDEPTNHLDIATKEMLMKALADFDGTMLFVSHDRQFLGALSNRVLELTADGVHMYGGGYTEYVSRTGHEAPGICMRKISINFNNNYTHSLEPINDKMYPPKRISANSPKFPVLFQYHSVLRSFIFILTLFKLLN